MKSYTIHPSDLLSNDFMTLWELFSRSLKKSKTRYEYMLAINMICEYCNCDFLLITYEMADRFFHFLVKERHLGIKSISSRLSYYRSIGSFITENKTLIDLNNYTNPFDAILADSYSEYLTPESIPTLKELDHLFVCSKNNDMLYLILALILRCGLAASEICPLTAESFQMDSFERMYISIKKPSQSRIVKVPDDVKILVLSYCENHGYHSGPVFFNKRGKPMQYHALYDLIRDAMQNAGLSYTMQDIRNASIAHMLHGMADPNDVAAYVGISERWLFRYRDVLNTLDKAPCDYQCFQLKYDHKGNGNGNT